MAEIYIPTKVHFGQAAALAISPPPGTVLLVCGTSIANSFREALADQLRQKAVFLHKIVKPLGEPWSEDINEAFAACPKDPVAVVGLGGGSVLDFAKALALLHVSGGGIEEYEFGQRAIKGALPLFLIPTTCGTGSEVTPYCVVNNSSTHRKYTLSHAALRPVEAAVDPELLRSLPISVRLATALDAVSHCLEALLNRAGNRLIDPLSEAGLQIAWARIGQIPTGKSSLDFLNDLARLSLYGGISIAHNRTGLIHTLSVAFAEFCDTPHGLLNTRLAPYALSLNLGGYNGRLASVVSGMTGKPLKDDDAALVVLSEWLQHAVGTGPVAPANEILKRAPKIVDRVLQDKGLAGVSHGVIEPASIARTVENIAHEIRL
jgi:alcohol dehydrogenase class IV